MLTSNSYECQLNKLNEVIQKINFELSDSEQRIVMFIIKHLNLSTSSTYELLLHDIYKEFGLCDEEEDSYRSIKAILKKLRDKSLFIAENEVETTISWLTKITIDRKRNIVQISLDDDIKNYLLALKNNFTEEKLRVILKMKSQYSIRFYNIINQYGTIKRKTILLDELKKLLMVDKIISYENIKEFKKYVLDQAIREINEYSEILIDYETVSKSNKIIKFNFIIKSKKQGTISK